MGWVVSATPRPLYTRKCAGKIHFHIILKSALGFTRGVSVFRLLLPTFCKYFSPFRAACLSHLALQYLITQSDHKAPPYAVFSIPLSIHPSPQISSSVPFSRKPSAYVPFCNMSDQVSHPYNAAEIPNILMAVRIPRT